MKRIFTLGFICLLMFSCKNENTKQETSESEIIEESTIEFKTVEGAKLASGQLLRVEDFPSEYIKPRPVDVWLPQDYSEDKKYNVLYMHDGQMLFDSTTTWNKQEWKVDEWASTLMSEGKTKDFIVVGIYNIADIRWQDLFPQKAIDFFDEDVKTKFINVPKQVTIRTNLKGDAYLKFIVEELKPVIDSTYSVYKDKEHTFVMGSSMGGLMSMYAISEYPKVFGGAACLSTHWVGGAAVDSDIPYSDAIFKYAEANLPQAGQCKLYFDYGNKTLDEHYPQYAPRVDAILKQKGYTEDNAKNLFFEGTDHSENSWNERLDQPLLFLLGNN